MKRALNFGSFSFLRTKSVVAVFGIAVSGIRFLLVADIEWLPKGFVGRFGTERPLWCGTLWTCGTERPIVSKMSLPLSFNGSNV